jgi:hypothetical protein
VVAAWLPVAVAAAEPEQYRWSGVERVVAVGDVHGACQSLESILAEAGLIDDELTWSGGATHLVLLGDVVDRGPESKRALALIMRLQAEATIAGGHVHFLLGNHEVMNLVGDLSYTSDAEFAAFAKQEDKKERKAAFKRTLRFSISHNGDLGKMRKVFTKRYPEGYFGHREAFSPDGIFGAWLLDQQILVIVNGVAFVHAGLSPMLLEVDADQINQVAMGELRRLVEAQWQLIELGVLTPEMSFKDQIDRISAMLPDGVDPAAAQQPARQMFEAAGGMVFRRDGPLWYRGSALNPEPGEAALVAEVLAHLGADRVVIGHTPVHTDRITTRFDGEVVLADTGMLNEHYGGRASAVVMSEGVLYEAYTGEGQRALSDQRWQYTPEAFASDQDYLRFLESAPAVFMRDIGSGTTRPLEVWLADDGRRSRAVFKTIDDGDRRWAHEVAAYRLDRLLGHGMVPPTVQREIAGTTGSLQLWVENAINDEDRLAEDLEPPDPVEFKHQRDHADVFDLLIFNVDRNATNMLISTTDDWRISLIDHEQAFKPSLPSRYHLEDARSKLDQDLRELLQGLDVDAVRDELGGLLTDGQLDALLARLELLLAGTLPPIE